MTAVVCIVLVALVAIKDKAARALRNELEEARIENARLKEKNWQCRGIQQFGQRRDEGSIQVACRRYLFLAVGKIQGGE